MNKGETLKLDATFLQCVKEMVLVLDLKIKYSTATQAYTHTQNVIIGHKTKKIVKNSFESDFYYTNSDNILLRILQ